MFTVRLHHGKINVPNQLMHPQEVCSRDCVILKSIPFWYSILFPFPHQTKQPSKMRCMPYNALMQARTMPVPPASHALAPCVVLDPTFVESTLLAFPTNYRTASNSDTLNNCLAKIRELMDMSLLPFLLSVVWTTVANLMNLHKTRNKRLPQPCFAEKIQNQDFARPISSRASRIQGPISCLRIAQILPHMELASRASRPGLTVVF